MTPLLETVSDDFFKLLSEIDALSERRARDVIRYHRWGEGEPVCPQCGRPGHYEYRSRHLMKCGHCKHLYSETSGTFFASHKLSYQQMLKAIVLMDFDDERITVEDVMRIVGVSRRAAYDVKKLISIGRRCPQFFYWCRLPVPQEPKE